jgi:hypothetical protein
MSDRRSLIVSSDLGEFFRNEVTDARSALGIEMPEVIEFYLVNMLCEFSRHDKAVAVPGEEPLALMYKRALDAPVERRVQLLKSLGDMALYISGFFTEYIERSLVDIDYYVSMGGTAYSNVSSLVGGTKKGETFAEIYGQLSKKFTELVDLLSEISDRARAPNDKQSSDLLKLYDRWARTGSSRLRKLLVDKGLVPNDGLSTEYIQ